MEDLKYQSGCWVPIWSKYVKYGAETYDDDDDDLMVRTVGVVGKYVMPMRGFSTDMPSVWMRVHTYVKSKGLRFDDYTVPSERPSDSILIIISKCFFRNLNPYEKVTWRSSGRNNGMRPECASKYFQVYFGELEAWV